MIQKLQCRVDEQSEELASLRHQLENNRGEAKLMCDQQKGQQPRYEGEGQVGGGGKVGGEG